MKKDDFLKTLSEMTPQQMSQMIREKGKPRKIIDAFIPIDSNYKEGDANEVSNN